MKAGWAGNFSKVSGENLGNHVSCHLLYGRNVLLVRLGVCQVTSYHLITPDIS